MHDSSEAYPNGFSVPPSPQNLSFVHSFIINSCFTSVSQRGGTDSAEPTPDTGYKQNEHWHHPLLEQYNPLPAATQFHVH